MTSNEFPIIYDQKSGNALWIDLRQLNLRYQIPVGKIGKFFEGLKQDKVLATKCPKCEEIYFPPQDDCPKCKISGLEWIEMPEEGELLSYSVINVKPPSFSHYPDYVVGIAKMKNGVNVLAWIKSKDLKIGMKVKLKVVKREPEGYLTYELGD
ncbi:3-hydroxybutyryl-CoA epimerase [Candidatus Acidianus copahuensis]|uniref:3-hydroxybutyryl-CoA epimerase n=1 Tax=Candidatus Acidianus copahuensis TaxID=1160895 RepID=A0A031LQJ5_9CREN|nr:Zn-ribbon domain-containing OB-fold protein [Candidatus Acidianus copahuensis]EZQ06699.1 3-hydroxybutyryl-CoA epimerase [Candidatus Acidianus copahuensis]